MIDVVLDRLLKKINYIEEVDRSFIIELVRRKSVIKAFAIFKEKTFKLDEGSSNLSAIHVYFLHLLGEYSKANKILDEMIGIDISEKFSLKNCRTEIQIMNDWDFSMEGVSILCSTFNHARFIDMTLAGFFSQIGIHPFEVIVRDDASTDETVEIVKKWVGRYPNIIRPIFLPNNTYSQGVAPMPAILSMAKYPLIAMCEGDDFWVDIRKIERQAKLLQVNHSWAGVVDNHFELNEENGVIVPGRLTEMQGFLSKNDLLTVKFVLWVHTLMFRNSLCNIPYYNHLDGILGDQVLTVSIGLGGAVYFQGGDFGSVSRRNLSSTYTPLSESEKQSKRIKTRLFLFEFLMANNERMAANHMRRWCQYALQNEFDEID